jgi:catechol 2,3-dioxygenase-like lactoylglutathione lyase family enzyme
MKSMLERLRTSPSMISGGALALLIALIIGLAGLLGTAQLSAAAAQRKPASVVVRDVTSVGFTVSDMERSVAFFHDVLTFEKVADVEVAGEAYEHLTGVFGVRMRTVTMRLGNDNIELTEYLTPRGRPIPVDSASNDRWFQHIAIIVPDMQRAYEHLRKHQVRFASTGPQRLPDWNKDAGGIEAFYFRDPDDHVLELLAFPPDKGNPKWREAAARDPERLFLGIDHTAIVIGESEASLRFYRDSLGFNIAGTSENYGTEQEHLNNVFGARLRITSIRPPGATGPSVEFLEYVAPRTGRPYPTDSRASDLWHWQTTLVVDDLEAAARALDAAQSTWISNGVVTMSDAVLGFSRGALLRDPDGHAVRVVQR